MDEIMSEDLLKDSQWSAIDGELCRVIDFVPMASIKGGKIFAIDKTTPYASVLLECKKLPTQVTGFITNKEDFLHLWTAFKERTIKQDEEVLIIWTKKHYKNLFFRIFSAGLPKLWVMVCPKEANRTNYRLEAGSHGVMKLMVL